MAQSEQRSEALPSDLAPEYLRTLDDGTVLTVERAGKNRCDVKRADGETAYFALTCGASRLKPLDDPQ